MNMKTGKEMKKKTRRRRSRRQENVSEGEEKCALFPYVSQTKFPVGPSAFMNIPKSDTNYIIFIACHRIQDTHTHTHTHTCTPTALTFHTPLHQHSHALCPTNVHTSNILTPTLQFPPVTSTAALHLRISAPTNPRTVPTPFHCP